MWRITNIKIWAEQSASTLLLEANEGSYDETRDDLQIRRPTFKALQQKGLAAHSDGLIVYVDGQTHSLAPPAVAHPTPTHLPHAPQFRERKMRIKAGYSEGVVLKSAT